MDECRVCDNGLMIEGRSWQPLGSSAHQMHGLRRVDATIRRETTSASIRTSINRDKHYVEKLKRNLDRLARDLRRPGRRASPARSQTAPCGAPG